MPRTFRMFYTTKILVGLGCIGIVACGARTQLEVEGGSALGGQGGAGGSPKLATCGNGVLDTGEECDEGSSNEDRPAILLIHDGQSQAVIPIRGAQSDFDFYDYQSESAHTGFEKLHTSNLFLRQESGVSGLSLFSVSGIDLDSSGEDEGDGQVNQTFSGLPAGATVTLADDNPNEIQGGAPTVMATWQFHHNTDGGVIGGIAFPGAWVIEIDSTFIQAITNWRYEDSVAGPISLLGTTAILKALPTPSKCRLDCTVPRCGDGILDGGEVCDDGNRVSGDGCSADCSTTN